MKEIFQEWIINITLISIFTSIITRLLPGKTYLPYLRIFCGILMLLTFFQPVFQLLNLEHEIEFQFMEDLYEMERWQMENQLIALEERQRQEWETQYRAYLEEFEENQEEEKEENQIEEGDSEHAVKQGEERIDGLERED